MAQIQNVIVYGVTELIRVCVILEYFGIFQEINSVKRNTINCIITYAVTMLSYFVFHNALINMAVIISGIVFLSTGFVGQFKKKLLLSVMAFEIMFEAYLLASFLLQKVPAPNSLNSVNSFISVMFLICIEKFFKVNGKTDLSGQWYLLLFSALLSIAAIYIAYRDMAASRETVIMISVIVLFFNIMLCYFI